MRAGLVRSTAAASVLVLVTSAAYAQGTDAAQNDAAAQQLYDQATTAMDAKDYATACPKLEEVVRLAPEGVGAKLTLAECYEAWGRFASAYAAYLETVAAASRVKQPAQQKKALERQKKAQEEADAIAPKLAKLTVEVPEATGALPGFSVQQDGHDLPQNAWSTARPVDTGNHVVVATAPGHPRFEQTVSVDKNGVAVVVKVAFAEPAPVPAPAPDIAKPGLGTRRIIGISLAGAGAVGLVFGVVGGAQALGAKSARGAHCTGSVCDARGVSIVDGGRTWGDISTVGFIAGAALLGGGAVVYLTAPNARSKETALVVSPSSIALRTSW